MSMEDEALLQEIRAGLEENNLRGVRDRLVKLSPADVAELISELSSSEQAVIFRILPRETATGIFERMELEEQKQLLSALGDRRVAIILDGMSPDDRTALLEEIPASAAKQLLTLLSPEERAVALSLLGYPEHSVGRLMTPDYVAAKESWSVAQVLEHIREVGSLSGTLEVIYIIDDNGKLVDDLRIKKILVSPLDTPVHSLMNWSFAHLEVTQPQEEAIELFKHTKRGALPVIDSKGALLGIVTIDDVLILAEEEATEDIQKLGGAEALDMAYLETPIATLVKKRASWLVLLFLGEMLTATAMSYYEEQIARAVVLALFVPLIISSGGNSGSQAASLMIRSLALTEVETADWRRVMRRELVAGMALGTILGIFGFLRIALWAAIAGTYGPHWLMLGCSVALSLTLVVAWGSLSGAMLPLLLQRLGFDPATSSTPFVATMVDVTGVVIYFSIASILLGGLLL